MEVFKAISLTLAVSLGVAAAVAWLVSLVLNPLERARQRWVARERKAGKIVPA
jgi:hypothetical protein